MQLTYLKIFAMRMMKMSKSKKQGDLSIFIIGWVASTLAVGVPILFLIIIKNYFPGAQTDFGDKLSVIIYLLGAFFSGLFTTYRVVCKSSEKDLELKDKDSRIESLESEIEEAKKAYSSLSPKSKIISILLEIHQAASSLSKQDCTRLIMKYIKEINSDTTFDPRYDGMIAYAKDSDYKKEKLVSTTTSTTLQTTYNSNITGMMSSFKMT